MTEVKVVAWLLPHLHYWVNPGYQTQVSYCLCYMHSGYCVCTDRLSTHHKTLYLVRRTMYAKPLPRIFSKAQINGRQAILDQVVIHFYWLWHFCTQEYSNTATVTWASVISKSVYTVKFHYLYGRKISLAVSCRYYSSPRYNMLSRTYHSTVEHCEPISTDTVPLWGILLWIDMKIDWQAW